ncbi:unnamed protein product [Camellia sinensis]
MLVQFIDSYDPPLKGLHEDLNFVNPRIGEVLERAQDLANVTSYREWVLLGYLVCPDELLRVTSIDIALGLSIICVATDVGVKEDAKSGRTKQKEADLEYIVAKQVEKMISEVHEQALFSCDAIHRERRILLKQEIGRMVLFFTDQPSLLAPNIQNTRTLSGLQNDSCFNEYRLLKLVEMQSYMSSLFSCIKSSMPMYKLDKMQGEQQSKGCRSLELAFCILWGGNCDGSICYSRFCYKTFTVERFLPCWIKKSIDWYRDSCHRT